MALRYRFGSKISFHCHQNLSSSYFYIPKICIIPIPARVTSTPAPITPINCQKSIFKPEIKLPQSKSLSMRRCGKRYGNKHKKPGNDISFYFMCLLVALCSMRLSIFLSMANLFKYFITGLEKVLKGNSTIFQIPANTKTLAGDRPWARPRGIAPLSSATGIIAVIKTKSSFVIASSVSAAGKTVLPLNIAVFLKGH